MLVNYVYKQLISFARDIGYCYLLELIFVTVLSFKQCFCHFRDVMNEWCRAIEDKLHTLHIIDV